MRPQGGDYRQGEAALSGSLKFIYLIQSDKTHTHNDLKMLKMGASNGQ